ncbi:MAG: hypothetical protein ABID35_01435 [Candidatus Margulisiibacteriota bacterium]
MNSTILLSILIGVVIGLLLFFLLGKIWGRSGKTAEGEVSRFSEKEAESLLRRAGFQILGKKRRETVITVIDGKDHFGYLEADYIVRKNRRKYAVAVHIGEGSPDPNEPSLRRRLLEYDRGFALDGQLVLDLNRGEIHTVRFKFPREWNIDAFFRLLIAVFIIFLVIGIIWVLVTLKLF